MKSNKQIVLFDGVCNLCSRLVQFTIKHDNSEKFLFASLQSQAGQDLLLRHNASTSNVDSFVLIYQNEIKLKSTASLILLKELGSVWKIFYIFIVIPRPIRDYFYDVIANSRYKLFGKREQCMLPNKDLKKRFLK